MRKRIKRALVHPIQFAVGVVRRQKYVTGWDYERSLSNFLKIRRNRLFAKALPYTMLTYPRLANAFKLATLAEKKRLDGCFVECGVWRGGCAAVLAYASRLRGSARKVYLFDSFEGLPEPNAADGIEASLFAGGNGGELRSIGKCVGRLADVQHLLFEVLRLPRKDIILVKGWFQDTLPQMKSEIEGIAILRIDADWYESTRVCLENLYDRVVPGGYVIIDDYGHWEGCRKAVDDFMANRRLTVELVKIDYTGVYFQKR